MGIKGATDIVRNEIKRLDRWRQRARKPLEQKPCIGHWYEHQHDLKCLNCRDYWECFRLAVAHRKQLISEGKLKVDEIPTSIGGGQRTESGEI